MAYSEEIKERLNALSTSVDCYYWVMEFMPEDVEFRHCDLIRSILHRAEEIGYLQGKEYEKERLKGLLGL